MVAEFEACIRSGGVAVFPADTVYGLACAPDSREAVARLRRQGLVAEGEGSLALTERGRFLGGGVTAELLA